MARAVPARDVGVRLVDDIVVRRLRPNLFQQLQVGNEAATASLDGAVVLDLARHQDVPVGAGRTLEDKAALFIFADSSVNDEAPKTARAFNEVRVEFASLQDLFELARR